MSDEAKTDKWHIQSQANNYAKVGREGHLGFIVLWRDAEGLRDDLNRLEALAGLATRAEVTLGQVYDDLGHELRLRNGELNDLGDEVVDTLEALRNALTQDAAPAGARAANTEGEGT